MMNKQILLLGLLCVVTLISGCRCFTQGLNGLGKDFQAWTQPSVDKQQTEEQARMQQQLSRGYAED